MKTAWCPKHRLVLEIINEGTVEDLEYPPVLAEGKYGPQLPPTLGSYSTVALLECECVTRIATVGTW